MSVAENSLVKRWLVALRIVQIIVLLVGTAGSLWMLISSSQSLELLNSIPSRRMGSSDDLFSQPDMHLLQHVLKILVITSSVSLVFVLVALSLCITWLVYTLSPEKRARASCFGNHTCCMHYTGDMSADIVISLMYAAGFIMSLVTMNIIGIVISAVVMGLFIATAVLSGAMGKRARDARVDQAEGDAKVAAAIPPKQMELSQV